MAQRLNNLNKIISTLRSGADHYRRAARQTNKSEHEEIFCRHAEIREHHAKALSDIIEDVGGEVSLMDPTETLRAFWSRISAMGSQTERTLVKNLEEHEDQTLRVFRNAMDHPDNQRDLEMLHEMYNDFRQTHDHMRQIRRAYRGREGAGSDAGLAPTKATDDQPEWMKAKATTTKTGKGGGAKGSTASEEQRASA
jgi:uncharacterized protein (TIGR02284 family)